MRKIKFRGKSLTGEWFYGYLSLSFGLGSQPPKGFYISNSAGQPWAYDIRSETIGQFSGLKDKNGTEIYESDILNNGEAFEEPWLTKVIFKNGAFQLEDCNGFIQPCCEHDLLCWEVIGNIYENPELLEGK